jgi:hypothetical protein
MPLSRLAKEIDTTEVTTNVLKDTASGEYLEELTCTQVSTESTSVVKSGLSTPGMENTSLSK